MIPLPFGVAPGEVVDPDALSDEFVEFSRIARALTQWQWSESAFTDPTIIAKDQSVCVMSKKVHGFLQTVSGTDPVIADWMAGTIDSGIWQIPYNRGFTEIGGGDVTHSWTSEYPELVLSAFSFQYIRQDTQDFPGYDPADATTHLNIRGQVRLSFDGAPIDGSGFVAKAFDTRYRGTGIGQRSIRTTIVAIQLLPAGAHVVQPEAAQAPAVRLDGDDTTDAALYLDDPPSSGVCIGSRRHILIRSARAKLLRA